MDAVQSILRHNDESPTATNLPFHRHLLYRADDYSSLRFKMLEHLAELLPAWNRTLTENIGEQDMGVAFVELFAYMSEILSFYQDCRANEAFLRTAELPASLIELCTLVNYRISPGSSASTLQVFIAKQGQKGTIPAGYRVKTKPVSGKPTLIFETAGTLDADVTRNQLRLYGYDRSGRILNAPGRPQESNILLDKGYSGLAVSSFVVLTSGISIYAVQLTAVTTENGKVRIAWKSSTLPAGANLPIADLTILGKPKQSMVLAERARADEITAGQNSVKVNNPGIISEDDRVVFDSEGLRKPAKVIKKSMSIITWDHGFNLSLRRSQTRIYTGGHIGFAHAASLVRVGSMTVTSTSEDRHSTKPAAGDYLLLSDGGGVEMMLIAGVSRHTYHLAEAVPRTFPRGATFFRVKLNNPETGALGSLSTTVGSLRLDSALKTLVLDKAYEGLKHDAFLVLSDGVHTRVNRVDAVEVNQENQLVLTLQQGVGAAFTIATLVLYGPFEHSMRVDGYNRSEDSTVAGATSLTLNGTVPGLKSGDYLIVQGGNNVEGARVASLATVGGNTVVALHGQLNNSYPLASTVIIGNVVPLSHGESIVEQVIGSADQSQANQRFTLRRHPTTFVHDAERRRGVANTLQVFVDDRQWQEVESLADSEPDDLHYMIDVDDEQVMSFVFGDGKHGAKPASGRDNVSVRYRTGLGAEGNVAPGSLTVMPEPLPFLESTANYLEAAGGSDRDTVRETKRLTPITVRTLERAVSLSDYSDLALAYAGIVKARVDWSWEAGRKVIQVTVAAAEGKTLTPTLKDSLLAYLDSHRAPGHQLRILDHRSWPIRLRVEVHVLPNFLRLETKVRVERALGVGLTESGEEGYFHFNRRNLGEDLYLSDIYALVEALHGVDYVIAKAFHAEAASVPTDTVANAIRIPQDALATGGHTSDPAIGVLTVDIIGGIA